MNKLKTKISVEIKEEYINHERKRLSYNIIMEGENPFFSQSLHLSKEEFEELRNQLLTFKF